jgi:phage shock protein E
MDMHKALLLPLTAIVSTFLATACIGEANTRQTITASALLQQINTSTSPVVLDVRSPEEFRTGHVPGAVNIPHRQVGARLGELASGKERGIVVYCEGGPRAEYAEQVLENAGFEKVYHLEGDMAAWRMNRLPMETR